MFMFVIKKILAAIFLFFLLAAFCGLPVKEARSVGLECNQQGGILGPCQFPGGGAFASLQNSTVGTTTAITVTLTATATTTAFLCGFSVDAAATAGVDGVANIAGLLGGTFRFQHSIAVAPLVGSKSITFNPCLPASAVNTNIVLTTGIPGTAGVIAAAIWGYIQ